jgi:hypothetical protein
VIHSDLLKYSLYCRGTSTCHNIPITVTDDLKGPLVDEILRLYKERCRTINKLTYYFAFLIVGLLIPQFTIRAQTSLQISSWYQNTPDANAVLGVTSIRFGCSPKPESCFDAIAQAAASQEVQRIYLAIKMDPTTSATYAAQFSEWSLTHPILFSIGFDDLVNRMEHMQSDFGIAVPGTIVTDTLNASKSANPNVNFAVTMYEDQLGSSLLSDSNLPLSTRKGVDYVQLYVHYRKNGSNYPSYLQQTKALFPNAKIIAGAYAYDRIDYLPCSPGGVACTVQEDADLFNQLFLLQLDELKQGIVDQIEFFPGYFGIEAQWPDWSGRGCAAARLPQCIANTVAMRQTVAQDLSSAFGPPGALTSLSPRPIIFPVQDLSTTSGATTVTLHNPGTGLLNIASIAVVGGNVSDFSQQNSCPVILAANAKCLINITFTPSAVDTRTSQLIVTDSARRSPHSLDLSGLGANSLAPQVLLSPTTLDFKNQPVGTTSAASTILLSNVGQSNLSINGLGISGTTTPQFAQTNNCGSTLFPAGSCTITVTFTPSTADNQTAQLVITDNAVGSPHTIPLTGKGTEPTVGQVLLSKTLLTFENQTVNITSATQSISLSNTGTTTVSISQLSLSGMNSLDFSETNTCGSSLPAGNSCSISVAFRPSSFGPRTADLTIADNASGSPQHVTLNGMGTASPQPVAMAFPVSLTFPSQTVKTASPAMSVTIRNTGSASLTIISIVISGANAAEFTQKNTCTATTAVGADCSISVVFTPAAPGSRTAQIVITDNASGSPQQVGLSGTGMSAAPPDFTISVTPGSASLNSGQSAAFKLSIAASNGFTKPITFACSGLPSAASCSFSPVSVTPGGSPATVTTLNITTVARSSELFQMPKQRLVFLCMAAIWLFLRLYRPTILFRTRRCIVRFAAIVVLAAGLLAGCGGVISGPVSVTNSGTPAGTFDVSVAASSGNLSQQVNLSLIVK